MLEVNFRGSASGKVLPKVLLLALLFSLVPLLMGIAFAQNQPGEWADGELLVGLRNGVSSDRARSLFDAHGAIVLQELSQLNVHRISVSPAALESVERALSRRPEVQFVERNGVLELAVTPNDPYYPSAWHLGNIGAPAAWDTTQGSSNVIIAVVDTGVDPSHPDLVNKLVPGRNTYNGNNDTADIPYRYLCA